MWDGWHPALGRAAERARQTPHVHTRHSVHFAVDPLGLGSADFWSVGNDKTYAFLRHAEIKCAARRHPPAPIGWPAHRQPALSLTPDASCGRHGRVAMAAFVGFIVQSNGLHWPFPMTPGFEYTAVTPPEQWDALPFEGKWQIIAFIGFLEWWGEFGGTHYMAGGKPGDLTSRRAAG